ncbi:MAG: helix-turn-helix transcriptional regulator [Candidatus Lokiarchaeota archaeon]|nr:helix-turn-helix transcriptional regulator [Candidatus Lokiarchaeota archaeon]
MKISLTKEDFSERQIHILDLLFEKEYQQKNLQEALKTTAPNLYYHLNKLEELDLVKKNTLYEVGNVKINMISLNPASRQQVRKLIGKEVSNYVLITGFGELKTGYRVPDLVYNILIKYHYPISRVICFTSQDAKSKRMEFKEQENLIDIDEFFVYPYEDYRFIESGFFQSIEIKISEEMETANILIDLTPLSKLFSFKLLELANKYQIPCVYLGMDKQGNDKLYWMSNMKIEGKIETFD